MLRRRLLCSGFALFLPSVAWSNERARWIGAILEAVEDLQEIIDWSIWSSQAAAALRAGKPLPANPGATGDFDERLERTQQRVAALKPPAFEALLPVIGPVPTGSFDATRDTIRGWTLLTESAWMELTETSMALKEYDLGAARIATSDRALRKLAEICEQVMSDVPIYPIQLRAGFEYASIVTSYLPRIADIENTLLERRKTYSASIDGRRGQVGALAGQILALLKLEAIDLSTEAQMLEKRTAALQARKDDLDEELSALNAIQHEMDRLRTQLEDTEERMWRTERDIDNVQRDRQYARQERQRLNDLLNQPYNLCPRGASYETCDHHDYRRQWDERQRNLTSHINQQTQRLNQLSARENQLRQELNGLNATLDGLEQRLAQRRLAHAQREQAYDARLAQFNTDLRKLFEDKWRSRADVYTAANAREQQRIGEIAGSLQ